MTYDNDTGTLKTEDAESKRADTVERLARERDSRDSTRTAGRRRYEPSDKGQAV